MAYLQSSGSDLALVSNTWHRPASQLRLQDPAVEQYHPAFTAHLAERGRAVPGYVQREFEDYLKCGRLEPVFSYSIHYIAHEGFRDVIGNFCEEEAESVREYHQDTHALLPFKQEI